EPPVAPEPGRLHLSEDRHLDGGVLWLDLRGRWELVDRTHQLVGWPPGDRLFKLRVPTGLIGSIEHGRGPDATAVRVADDLSRPPRQLAQVARRHRRWCGDPFGCPRRALEGDLGAT